MRTSPDLVRAAIKIDSNVEVTPSIRTATKLVDYIVSRDTAGILTSSGLDQELETYLACFYLALKHQQFTNKSTGDASAGFQVGAQDRGFFNQNDWGKQALGIDVTGVLAELNDPDKGTKVASLGWLGTPILNQTPWWMRDGNASGV